jgi:hypothetical protein
VQSVSDVQSGTGVSGTHEPDAQWYPVVQSRSVVHPLGVVAAQSRLVGTHWFDVPLTATHRYPAPHAASLVQLRPQ